jgi:hypothetical protein
VWDHIGGDIDFCIDDASHIDMLTINTFMLGMKHIKPGGWYVIEDTHTSFHSNFNKEHGMLYNFIYNIITEQQLFALGDQDFYQARDTNPDNMKSFASLIYSFHCYKSVVMFERAHD